MKLRSAAAPVVALCALIGSAACGPRATPDGSGAKPTDVRRYVGRTEAVFYRLAIHGDDAVVVTMTPQAALKPGEYPELRGTLDRKESAIRLWSPILNEMLNWPVAFMNDGSLSVKVGSRSGFVRFTESK